jgi:hypothetical protein
MTRNALIALAATAAVTVGFATQAQAKPHFNIDFGINLGAPLYDGGYYGDNYYDAGYDEDVCGYQIVKRVKWNYSHTHKFVTYKKVWVCN